MRRWIGVDLAWKPDKNPTAVAVLEGTSRRARLVSLERALTSLEDVAAFTLDRSARHSVVAVDASLVVPNATGQRRCERELSSAYGSRGASTHATNRTLYPDPPGPRLVSRLGEHGFDHVALSADPPLSGRRLAEVYPHAAMVELFDLDYRIPYKKGRVAQKRRGLSRLRELIRSLEHADLPLETTPALEALTSEDLEALRGRALKSYEDALDALFCAYLAFRMTWLAGDGFRMFGDVERGYIVNPSAPLAS